MSRKHKVLVDDPHIASLAARILLGERLSKEQLSGWLAFREAFLEEKMKEGGLKCHYCGKENLLQSDKTPSPSFLATIDHVVPVSKGGAWKDEANLVVACYPCNHMKGDKDVEEMLEWLRK